MLASARCARPSSTARVVECYTLVLGTARRQRVLRAVGDRRRAAGDLLQGDVGSCRRRDGDRRSRAADDPLEHAERAESGRVLERLGLADTAAGRQRGEVADRGPLLPHPAAFVDECDEPWARSQSACDVSASGGRTAASWSTATSHVMSWSPSASSSGAAAPVAAVRAQPVVRTAARHRRGRRRVVDDDDPPALDGGERGAQATPAAASWHAAPGGPSAAARRAAAPCRSRPARACSTSVRSSARARRTLRAQPDSVRS